MSFSIKNGVNFSPYIKSSSDRVDDLRFKFLEQILNYISYGLKTQKEVMQKLSSYVGNPKFSLTEKDKNYILDYILERLRSLDLIDDSKVLHDISSKVSGSTRPRNKQKLQNLLFKRGFDADSISGFLSTLPKGYEYGCAKKDFLRKSRSTQDSSKIKSFLLRKGYSFEVIEQLMSSNIE